jgi:dephospho-CoA kinase
MPKVIGLTGNIACGKSAVGKILESRGIPVLDSDSVVHELYDHDSRVQAAVLEAFGTLDRSEIAKLVFGDSKEAKDTRKSLEAIIHPAVDNKLRQWIRDHNHHPLLFNLVPLIFEAGLESRYDYIVTVLCPEDQQRTRLKNRQATLSDEEISKRIQSQMSQEEKAVRSNYVLDNSSGFEYLESQVNELLKELGENPF